MVLDFLPPGTIEKVAEKAGDLLAHWGLYAWQVRSLEHKCSPSLRCEAATINVTCPEQATTAACDYKYHILINQLLWAGVCALVVCRGLLLSCSVWLCVRGPTASTSSPSTGKAQAFALKQKYGILADR